MRKAHTKQCDGITPACGPCKAKRTECAYASDPNVSRFAALKSEFEQLKTSLGDLSPIYERLKHGSVEESSRLLERIRTEDGIPGLSEDKGTPRSVDDPQPGDHNTLLVDEHEEPQAGYCAWVPQESSLPLEPTPEVGAMSQWIGPSDPNLIGEDHSGFPLSPVAAIQHPGPDDLQTSTSSQRDIRSHISVSHRVFLWPEVVRHMRESRLAEAAGSDLQCIARIGSPWLLQRKTSKDRSKLPCNDGLKCSTLSTGSVIFLSLIHI